VSGPSFKPEGLVQRAKFSQSGRWLLSSALGSLARTIPGADALTRYQLQRAAAARLLKHLAVELQIDGMDHLPQEPHVIVSLHESLADGLCLLQLGLPLRFVVRNEIFRWPLVGSALHAMGLTELNLDGGGAPIGTILRAARESISNGEHFAVFPQGTVLGVESAFRDGAFRLAQSMRVPLLPVVIVGTHRIWEHPFSPVLRYGIKARMVVLPPVSSTEVAALETGELRGRVESAMKRVALSSGRVRPRRYVPERDGYWDGYSFEIDPAFPALRQQVARHRRHVGRR